MEWGILIKQLHLQAAQENNNMRECLVSGLTV